MSWILRIQKANKFPKSAYSIKPNKWCSNNTLKFVYINVRLTRLPVCTVSCLCLFHVLVTQTGWHYPTVKRDYQLQYPIPLNTLRTADADLRIYVTTVQDGWRRFAFLTRWNSVHLQVLLSATPQGGMFPEVSHPQALLGSLMSISWKFQFTKIVSEFVINF